MTICFKIAFIAAVDYLRIYCKSNNSVVLFDSYSLPSIILPSLTTHRFTSFIKYQNFSPLYDYLIKIINYNIFAQTLKFHYYLPFKCINFTSKNTSLNLANSLYFTITCITESLNHFTAQL